LPSPLAAAAQTNIVTLVPSSLDLPEQLDAAELRAALATAGSRWSYPRVPCTSLELRTAAPAAYRQVARDGRNLFVFRSQKWCHNQQCGPGRTFPRLAAAMTTVHGAGSGSHLAEADVELNGVEFHWSLGSAPAPHTSRSVAPLVPVLVHEIGHVLDFRDTCGSRHGASGQHDCPQAELESVMFSGSGRADLSAWDIERVCTRFPRKLGRTPDLSTAEKPDAGGRAWLAAAAASMLAWLIARRLVRRS
jgi:hypothetical protein